MDSYLAGAIAGIIGGLTIAAVGMVYGAASGRGFWSLPNGIGGIVLGSERGDTRSFGLPTLTGVGLHMVLSALYGVIIVFLGQTITGEYLLTGVVFAIAVWLFNYYAVGAVHAGSKKLAGLNPVPVALFLHALFGAVTGIVAPMLGA